MQALKAESIGAQASSDATDAVLLDAPLPVATLPGFETGAVSVQDAAAQLARGPSRGERVNACPRCLRSAGRKRPVISWSARDLDLVAIDRSTERLSQLEQNLRRLDLTATVIAGDAAETATWWDGRPFERILLDAPCTATGVIRRHPDVKLLRRASDVEPLRREQLRLLRALWPLLGDGGRLLYATCSVLRAENEQVVTTFLDGEPRATSIPIPVSFGPAECAWQAMLASRSCREKRVWTASIMLAWKSAAPESRRELVCLIAYRLHAAAPAAVGCG